MRRFVPALVLALSLLVLAGSSGAADGDAYLKNCYTTAPAGSCVGLAPAFQGVDAELSPGARHLYAVVWGFAGGYTGLRLFDVGTRGAFTPREGVAGCYAPGGAGGDCTPLIADAGAYDVDISADGKSVYVPTGGKLTVLNRDTTSGVLSPAQCFGSPPCVADPGSFVSAAGTLDSANLYVRGVGQLAVFDRDVTTGSLAPKSGSGSCFTEEGASGGCTPATPGVGIASSGYETVVSVDGRNVYVSNQAPGGVAVFQRAAGGSLSQEPGTAGGCITVGGTSGSAGGQECVVGPATLAGATALTIDPTDLVANLRRSSEFKWAYEVSKLNKPVDPEEWSATPQTVNAYYSSTRNEIVFPAGILQAPFFDPNADSAINYGAIGGVIEATVEAMAKLGAQPKRIVAAVGPCIAQDSYEVGPEFPAPFVAEDRMNGRHFRADTNKDGEPRWRFDIAGYVTDKLERLGLAAVEALPYDTCADDRHFFSYRRACLRGESDYGRGLSAIALAD